MQVRTISVPGIPDGTEACPPPRRRVQRLRSGCSVEAALGIIGGRWKGVVLYWLLRGRHRFGELRRRLPGCTQRVLTLQLRELEADGLVSRTVFPEVPPRVEYELTPLGRTLEPILMAIREWGDRHTPGPYRACALADGQRGES